MITLEKATGLQHFKKVVVVWTGHVTSGWPTSFHTYVYNDAINGLVTFGNDDTECQLLTWFIPNGAVPYGSATFADEQSAFTHFKQTYGDRLIVWANHKDGMPMVNAWAQSDNVIRSVDLKLPPFTGATQSEFKEWASEILELAEGDAQVVIHRVI